MWLRYEYHSVSKKWLVSYLSLSGRGQTLHPMVSRNAGWAIARRDGRMMILLSTVHVCIYSMEYTSHYDDSPLSCENWLCMRL